MQEVKPLGCIIVFSPSKRKLLLHFGCELWSPIEELSPISYQETGHTARCRSLLLFIWGKGWFHGHAKERGWSEEIKAIILHDVLMILNCWVRVWSSFIF